MSNNVLAFVKGQFTQIPSSISPHLAAWRRLHGAVFRALVAEMGGRKASYKVTSRRLSEVIRRLEGDFRSPENVRKSLCDLEAWGFIRSSDVSWGHRGRHWELAGFDFPAPEGLDYLRDRPDFKTRQRGSQGAKNRLLLPLELIRPLELVPVDPRTPGPLPRTPGDLGDKPDPRTPGGPDKARSHFPTRSPLTPTGGEEGESQIVEAWAAVHQKREVRPCTARTVRAALRKAREMNPTLTDAERVAALLELARRNDLPADTKHPILRAAAGDLAGALKPQGVATPAHKLFSAYKPPVNVVSIDEMRSSLQALFG
jgi:hypothetical protein